MIQKNNKEKARIQLEKLIEAAQIELINLEKNVEFDTINIMIIARKLTLLKGAIKSENGNVLLQKKHVMINKLKALIEDLEKKQDNAIKPCNYTQGRIDMAKEILRQLENKSQ